MKLFNAFLFILFEFFVYSSSGQAIMREVENLDLPSHHIYDIQQDARGQMWFASNRGIVKFNGNASTLFTVKDGLPFNDIFHMEIDPSDGNVIWYFASGNYCGYIRNDSVFKVSNPLGETINPSQYHITDNEIWIESMSDLYWINQDGFYKILTAKEKENYSLEFSRLIRKDLSSRDIMIVTDKNKISTMFVTDDTVYQYFPLSNKTTKFKVDLKGVHSKDLLNSGHISSDIYALFYPQGLALLNLSTKQSKFYKFPYDLTINQLKYATCELTATGIQLCIPGYLFIFNDQLELIENYSIPKSEGTHSYYRDIKGNIWVPEYSNGIQLIPKITLHTETFLRGSKVNKLSEFNGEIIADVSDKGYFRLAPMDDKFIFDENLPSKLLSYGDRRISEDKLILISSGTSYELSNEGAKPFGITMKNGGIHFGLKDVYLTENRGYAIVAGEFITFNPVTHTEVSSIRATGATNLELFKGQLYIAGTFGLSTLVGDSICRMSSTSEIFDIPVNCITKYRDFLIIGTDGRGIYFFNEEYTVHAQTTDDLIVRKIIPNQDELWLATDKGVIEISINKKSTDYLKITNTFYRGDGLITDNVNDICVQGDFLFVASDFGISKIDPKNPIYREPISLSFNEDRDTVYSRFADNEQISIIFSINEFVNQENCEMFFRLNETKIWTKTENQKLDFYNLKPGMHKLEVKVSDQHFNSATETIYIKIEPLWWQTNKFKILFLVFGFLLLLGIVKIVRYKIRKVMDVQIERSKKLYRLELQALRSQMNPHFVHNALNSIQYYILRNELEISEKYLEKFSTLIRLFFDYAHLQQITIRQEITLLKNYFEIEHLRFEDELEYEILWDDRIDIDIQVLPSMILQPLVENAINHGIFHKPGKGKVSVKFIYNNDSSFSVIVQDDGIGGINETALETNKDQKNRRNSTAVMHERLKLFEKTGLWQINYTITDLSERDYQTGTRIKIRIDETQNNNATR